VTTIHLPGTMIPSSDASAEPPTVMSDDWSLVQRILRMPLIGKLLGANFLIALAALTVSAEFGHPGLFPLVCAALAVSFVASALLIRLALVPLNGLQAVAQRVSEGDFSARVLASPIADAQIAGLGETLNRLMGRVEGDRARIRHLVRQSLRVREAEHARIAEELREATAQQLSAMAMHLAAAVRECEDPAVAPNLVAARDIATQMVEDVQLVAESVYPGLLAEFGLAAALEALGRRASRRSSLEVHVSADPDISTLPQSLMTALYRVADESVRNVERHAHAGSAWVTLSQTGNDVRLQIDDDGTGFDVIEEDRLSSGIGLFRARELLAHAGGHLQISSAPGSGTSVVAMAAVHEETNQ
jgi:two-component system, NarL family, sensor histidine kinase UhpB